MSKVKFKDLLGVDGCAAMLSQQLVVLRINGKFVHCFGKSWSPKTTVVGTK